MSERLIPCKYFVKTGSCQQGSSCRYNHSAAAVEAYQAVGDSLFDDDPEPPQRPQRMARTRPEYSRYVPQQASGEGGVLRRPQPFIYGFSNDGDVDDGGATATLRSLAFMPAMHSSSHHVPFGGRGRVLNGQRAARIDPVAMMGSFQTGHRFGHHRSTTRNGPDVDNMSYEELLALCEAQGDVSVGVPPDVMQAMAPTSANGGDDDDAECSICVEPICSGEMVRRLPCGHQYHSGCIEPWFVTKRSCPVCKIDVVDACRQRERHAATVAAKKKKPFKGIGGLKPS